MIGSIIAPGKEGFRHMSSPRIGLALGGGGARGLAHIPVLEALDELGLKPAAIAGTSIGSIIGAGYAGGLAGEDLRQIAVDTFKKRTEALGKLWKLRPRKFADLFAGGGLAQFDATRVLEVFAGPSIPRDFKDLKIPLTVVATDFYDCSQVIIRAGDLHRAVAASIAIPVVFRPVTFEGRVMIDGGVVNPLPFDALPGKLDVVIGVDVVGSPNQRHGRALPSASESIFGATQILMQTITAEKLKTRHPDILIKPAINSFRILEFLKADAVLAAAEPVKDELKRKLDKRLKSLQAA